jgi:hypothetical protein
MAWQVSGDYFESCSCAYLCPCVPSSFGARPTKGWCVFAFSFQIARGRFGDVGLNGLGFAVLGRTPDVMGAGNWSVGLIVDERASAAQEEAITKIVSGQAGGPMAALSPLITNFLGVERRPITFEKSGMRRSSSIAGRLEQTIEGVPGAANPGEPIYVDNAPHPANSRLALAKATRSSVHAFGIDWEDMSGTNNGHFAPFTWQG